MELITLRMNDLSKVAGTQVLIEKITYNLLTAKGSMGWNLAQGSLMPLFGLNAVNADLTKFRNLVQRDVDAIKTQMLQNFTDPGLPDNQFFVDLYIDSIVPDPSDVTKILVDLKLVTKANQTIITLP